MESWEFYWRDWLDQNQVSCYLHYQKAFSFIISWSKESYSIIISGYLPQQGRLLILMMFYGYLHVPLTNLLLNAVGAQSWHPHTFKGVFCVRKLLELLVARPCPLGLSYLMNRELHMWVLPLEISMFSNCVRGITIWVGYDSLMIYLVLEKWVSSLYILALLIGFSMLTTIRLTLTECPFTKEGYGLGYLSSPF